MNPHLFVYGTLMSTGSAPLSEMLKGRVRFLSPAAATGRLYHLGIFPGLVEEAGFTVYGELWELSHPQQDFEFLDAYEDVAEGVFTRKLVTLLLLQSQVTEAWVYIFTADLGHAKPISSGKWT